MKLPSLVPDRNLILLLIQLGLTVVIYIFFIPLCDPPDSTNSTLLFLIAILGPTIIVTPIPKWKKYKNLKFRDEEHPISNNNINLLYMFFFPSIYAFFLLIYYYVDVLNSHLDKNIWFLSMSVIYFIGVFLFLINRLSTK
jgi:hypothetical protein